MVRHAWLTAAALAVAGPAAAAPDWAPAGGGLFVGKAPDDGAPTATLAPAASPNGGAPTLQPLTQPFGDAVASAAQRHGLDPKLLHALVTVESAYRAKAVSRAGAAGLTQLMPSTAAELGVKDRFDPADNLGGGADYLSKQLIRFGDLRLALAAYNAGPGRVAQLGRIPDIRETRDYVDSVIECFLALSAGRGVRSSRECRSPRGAP